MWIARFEIQVSILFCDHSLKMNLILSRRKIEVKPSGCRVMGRFKFNLTFFAFILFHIATVSGWRLQRVSSGRHYFRRQGPRSPDRQGPGSPHQQHPGTKNKCQAHDPTLFSIGEKPWICPVFTVTPGLHGKA